MEPICALCRRNAACDFQGLIKILGVDQIVPKQRLTGLGERTVRDDRLSILRRYAIERALLFEDWNEVDRQADALTMGEWAVGVGTVWGNSNHRTAGSGHRPPHHKQTHALQQLPS